MLYIDEKISHGEWLMVQVLTCPVLVGHSSFGEIGAQSAHFFLIHA